MHFERDGQTPFSLTIVIKSQFLVLICPKKRPKISKSVSLKRPPPPICPSKSQIHFVVPPKLSWQDFWPPNPDRYSLGPNWFNWFRIWMVPNLITESQPHVSAFFYFPLVPSHRNSSRNSFDHSGCACISSIHQPFFVVLLFRDPNRFVLTREFVTRKLLGPNK